MNVALQTLCQDLCDQWGLDEGAKSKLQDLTTEQLQKVITEFQVEDGTHNPSAKFITFLRSNGMLGDMGMGGGGMDGLSGMGTGAGVNDINEFVARWGLDDGAASMLHGADPARQQIAMTEFCPQEGTSNISGRFISFFVKIPKGGKGGKGGNAGFQSQQLPMHLQNAMSSGGGDDPISAFVSFWGLEPGPEQMLRDADPGRLQKALNEFCPKEGTENVNGKFISFFIKLPKGGKDGREGKGGQGMGMQGMGMGGMGMGGMGMGGMGMGGMGMGGMGMGGMGMQGMGMQGMGMQGGGQNLPSPQTPGRVGSQGMQGMGMQGGGGDPIGAFVSRWGLDSGPEQMLRNADPVRQQKALTEFCPLEGTENVNGKFISFFIKLPKGPKMQGGMEGMGMGMGMQGGGGMGMQGKGGGMQGMMGMQGKGMQGMGMQGMGMQGGGGGGNIEMFINKWGLDDGAAQMLREAHPERQMKALNEFNPQGVTSNISGKFISFFTKLPKGGSGKGMQGGGMGGMGMGGMGMGGMGMGGMGMQGGGMGGMGMQGGGMQGGGQDPMSAFVAFWGLDAGAEEMLRSTNPMKAQKVMQEFNPQGETTNVSGKFISFLAKLGKPSGGKGEKGFSPY